ncbi:MAG: hypothetical protein JWR34_5853 [Mycobacterium sp.]|nr:hypothetical protein [Mycobacterium sp.]
MIAAASVFAGYSAVMLVPERGMTRTGGPGIVAFELAGTEERANQIMDSWGDSGRRAARTSLRLDFGYASSYGVLAGMLLDRIRQRHNGSRLIVLVAGAAALADAVQVYSLLSILKGADTAVNARRGRRAALAKFGFLAAALGYMAWSLLRSESVDASVSHPQG